MTKEREYIKFLNDLKSRIRRVQYQVYRTVNKQLIKLYWDIGKSIVEKQERLGWGQKIIQKLSRDLQKEFPQNSGFSERSLKYMRKFYLTYRNKPKMQPLVAQIPWSHNIIILDKTKNDYEKEYYCRMVLKNSWSKRILIHQIEAKSFERFLVNNKTHNFDKSLPVKISKEAQKILKDSYVLDFLEISEDLKEKELENKLLEKIKEFLLELGVGFTFVGNQYKIKLGQNEYFIDLLFYHRHLRCLVAIDLKIGEFIPEYAGKMNFYLNLLDDKVRSKDENPSIGIILCKEKDNVVVKYALRNIGKPMGVAKYYQTRKLPPKLSKQLPAPAVIKKKLKELSEEII
ncbi:MAG TPA: DUF1016 domain-containing protein [Candidatus Atribacteria bacterium]|nr:DUF1016 domain-containing protein [Candidatus Atribacteria bacterium]